MEKGRPPRLEKQTSSLPNTEAILELAPLPVALAEGRSHSVRYVNPAFCTLVGKASGELIGRGLTEILPDGTECLVLLDRVYRTREPASQAAHDHSGYWAYDIWAVLAEGDRPSGIGGVRFVSFGGVVVLGHGVSFCRSLRLMSGEYMGMYTSSGPNRP